ncbi:anaerobic C4-dicarboxylate transporter [Campylobacter geochelonis]|uniref:C4-dicarboxylate transporter DcuA n=1 Tax=Campylobacter geochelonis TaxID=1780362 RepID=A0A128EC21_9BACT|nr:anaerobic C4-dicarboxylate transporter [Campylobacter geochelonis]QKF72191.1 anaerobic C4-dicarboxylate transporter, DcuA/DcuB family [Campylobacter geochelonis]CZE46084.1 IspD/IspF bifunctional enzyme [Campylobacter geochelonis]CZE46544.1 IspD/IspF bifunctional enzyme [Campylobacter geochelonis]
MDIMLILQIIVLLGGIYLGVRLGGMGVGYAGGLGVIVLTLFLGMKTDLSHIPVDVILIIASVIAAITALQVAGGLDYMVQIAEKILRNNPKYINYLGPAVTYFLTILAGTGHTAFSTIPVIVEVAKGQNIKPSAPLALSVVSSQIAITASPISAAVVAMTGVTEKLGVSYPLLLGICIPTTFVGCMITSFIVNKFWDLDLSKDPIYQERLEKGLVAKVDTNVSYKEVSPESKRSLWIFIIGILVTVCYAFSISDNIKLFDKNILGRDSAIMSFMLAIGAIITITCKVETGKLIESSTFKSGMNACICVLGIAWLGNVFVQGHIGEIKDMASHIVTKYPFVLAIALYFVSCLLYSQAATTKVMMPAIAAALGMTMDNNGQVWILVASFAAASGLFILPTYPTVLGAIAMDDTGTTRVGKYIFNHSFIVPGTLAVFFSVLLGFIVAPMLIG